MAIPQRFQARDDDGQEYTIFVEVRQKRLSGGSYIDSLPHLWTWTRPGVRSSVTVLEKGRRYQIVQTAVILTSTDPNRF